MNRPCHCRCCVCCVCCLLLPLLLLPLRLLLLPLLPLPVFDLQPAAAHNLIHSALSHLPCVPQGDVCFMHGRTMHSQGQFLTQDSVRMAMFADFQQEREIYPEFTKHPSS